jgi:cytoskeletal protein RodZ
VGVAERLAVECRSQPTRLNSVLAVSLPHAASARNGSSASKSASEDISVLSSVGVSGPDTVMHVTLVQK